MKAFFDRGYKLSVINDCRAWVSPEVEFAQVHTIPILSKTNFLQRFLPNTVEIIKILKEIHPNFVHLHVQHYYSFAIIQSRYPFILTSWGAEVLSLPNANVLDKSTAKIAATRARFVTVDAFCLKEIWIKMGVPENKIKVIPFGVDLSIFNPDINAYHIRKNLEIGKDNIVVISTRALDNSHYNVECLIKAIPLILKRHQEVIFIIKGAGPLKAYFKNLVDKLDVSEHVRFVGLTPHHEVAQYLAASDIYVSTPFIDTTSVSLLEAMACGLPPIVTDIEGNREWIENGTNGLLFEPRNYMELSEKIIQLINDEDMRHEFGQRCYDVIKQKASWETCVNKMEALYQSVLSESSS